MLGMSDGFPLAVLTQNLPFESAGREECSSVDSTLVRSHEFVGTMKSLRYNTSILHLLNEAEVMDFLNGRSWDQLYLFIMNAVTVHFY